MPREPEFAGRAHCGLMVRLAGSEDVRAVSELVNAAYRGAVGGWTSEMALVDGPRIGDRQVRELLGATGSWLLAGWLEGAMIACVHLTQHGDDIHLGLLAVSPERQGAGVGSCMLEYAESCAGRLDGVQRVVISVLSLRPELIDYYRRRGYVPTGEVASYPVHLQVGIPKVPDLRVLILAKPLHAVTAAELP